MPFNQLVLYEDVPHAWDAWEIDPTYVEKPFPVQGPAESWRVVEESPLRCAIEVERPLGRASRITQRFVLEAGSARLDVRTEVDWHEERRLLRAYFPVDVRATRATYGTQFGHIERPAHRNTPWDRARFEVCAHGWMDLSEPGFGVALLDDCKYGHSCAGNVMGLTLLRSPKHPDPQADMGRHVFTYSLMPHHGDWRQAGVDREAEALNNPLIARPLPKQQEGTWSRQHAPVEIKALLPGRVEIAALKPAEEGDGVVLRLVETHGGRGEVRVHWRLPVREVQGVNLLEELVETPALNHDEGDRITTFLMKPFQVVTLRARLA
jgi:alpha-mannosidase